MNLVIRAFHLPRQPGRRLTASMVGGLLALTVVACSGPATMTPATSPVLDSSPASQPPGAPSASTPASATGFLEDTTVDTLLAEAATLDGWVVAVSGAFVADGGSAQLCSDMVVAPGSEQRCDGRIGLTGTIPAETLATFDTTRPPLRKLWYGYVTVIGTFRASGPAGEPIIEIDRIFLAG